MPPQICEIGHCAELLRSDTCKMHVTVNNNLFQPNKTIDVDEIIVADGTGSS